MHNVDLSVWIDGFFKTGDHVISGSNHVDPPNLISFIVSGALLDQGVAQLVAARIDALLDHVLQNHPQD